jgi:TPR repeat protein
MSIFLWKDNQQLGPFTWEEILEDLRSGKLTTENLAWSPGFEHWKPLAEILPIGPAGENPSTVSGLESAKEDSGAGSEKPAPLKRVWGVLLKNASTIIRLVKTQAFAKKRQLVDLRTADHRIGKKAYKSGALLSPGHEELASKIIDLQISVAGLKDEAKKSPATLVEKANVGLRAVAKAARAQVLSFKRHRLLTALGTELRTSPHIEVFLASEINAANLIFNDIMALEAEINKMKGETYWWARRPAWIIVILLAAGATWIGVGMTASSPNRDGVLLVNDRPLPSGTVILEPWAFYFQISSSGKPGPLMKRHIINRYEVRADDLIALTRALDTRYANFFGESSDQGPLERAPLLGKIEHGQWVFGLERGTPTAEQSGELKNLLPPPAADGLYPKIPVKIGERWEPEKGALKAYLRSLGAPEEWSVTGWMELSAIIEREGERRAVIDFSINIFNPQAKTAPVGRDWEMTGEIIRSLANFQDLSVTARGKKYFNEKDKEQGNASLSLDLQRIVSLPAGSQGSSAPPTPASPDEKPLAAEEWLSGQAAAGKRWAVVYLGTAHVTAARQGALCLPARAINLPEEALPYYEACNQILRHGQPKGNASEVRAMLSRAAGDGDPRSMTVLARMCSLGLGGPKDKDAAIHWFRQAADQGDLLAKAYLSNHLGDAKGQEERVLAQESAAGGNGVGMEQLAKFLEEGIGGAKDPQEAMKWRIKAADLGMVGPMAEVTAWVLANLPDDTARRNRNNYAPAIFDAAANHAAAYISELRSTFGEAKADASIAERIGAEIESSSPAQILAAGLYEDGARGGDLQSMYNLAWFYMGGKEAIKEDQPAALGWWEKAARLGNADSQGQLSLLAEKGNANAKTILDGMKRDGIQIDQSKVAAYIARQNEARAAFDREMQDYEETSARAHNYYKAKIEELDRKTEALKREREQHIRTAPRTLDGKVVLISEKTGDYFGGVVHYDAKTGDLDMDPSTPLPDLKESMILYNVPFWLDADKGNPEAQYQVAMKIVEERPDQVSYAFPWALKAAEQGHAAAQDLLGTLYFEGRGTDKDPVKAFEWYRKSAEQSYDNGCTNLGICYSKGEGVAQDYVEANRLFRLATDKGNEAAMFHLAINTANGYGTPRDRTEAIRLFRLASHCKTEWLANQAKEGLRQLGASNE